MADEKSSLLEPPPVEGKASISDSIAKNRALPITDPASIPMRPAEFKPTPIEIKRSALSRISERSRAEAKEALRECAEKGPELKKDLGEDTPEAENASELLIKIDLIERGKSRAQALYEYYSELDEIILSDAAEFLGEAGEEYEHRVKKRPNLENEYPKLKRHLSEHGEAVREGKRRKKQAREEAEKKLSGE